MNIQIIEYGEPYFIQMDHHTAEKLVFSAEIWKKRLKLKRSPLNIVKLTDNNYKIRAIGIAGFIKVNKLSINILPKFLNPENSDNKWRRAMWRFLAYGGGVKSIDYASGHYSGSEGISDLLADIFLQSLSGAYARGYAMGYKTNNTFSSYFKGRLDPNQYRKILPFTGKLPITSSNLTADVAINRLLKWAGRQLATTVESSELRKRLGSWLDELPNVSEILPRHFNIDREVLNYPHLSNAVGIAKLLLNDKKVNYHNEEEVTLPGFLWDCDDLFERVSRRLLSESALKLNINVTKRNHVLATYMKNGELKKSITIPDIDIWKGEKSLLIVDAKYKNFENTPMNNDFYQILSAGLVRSVTDVALIYPKEGYGLDTTIFNIPRSKNPEKVHILQIGLNSFSSKKELSKLKDEINKWINGVINL